MPFFTYDGDGKVAAKFNTRKKAVDEYDINQVVHFVTDAKGKVIVGDVPDGVDPVASLAEASEKPAGKEKADKAPAGGQRGGRNCPLCKGPMFPGMPAEDAATQKGMAYRKCPVDDYTRWHPIAHVAMLLSEVGWPTYRDNLGGGQRAARRVIELFTDGPATSGPEAYEMTVKESEFWEDWAPGRDAQRALTAAKKEREQEAKAAEKATAAAAKEAEKAEKAEKAAALKAEKAAERKAAKEAAAKEKADAKQIKGQETIDGVDLP